VSGEQRPPAPSGARPQRHRLLDGGRAYGPHGRLALAAPARCSCGWQSDDLDSVGARRLAHQQHVDDPATGTAAPTTTP